MVLRRFSRVWKVASPNRWEMYVSFAVVAYGVANMGLPVDLHEALLLPGCLLVASLCAFNALLDFRRLSIVERICVVPWSVFLLFVTPYIVWEMGHIRWFADRYSAPAAWASWSN